MPDYPVRVPFGTRWNDNDQYGHLNNAVYYEAMDTAMNAWMIGTPDSTRTATRRSPCAWRLRASSGRRPPSPSRSRWAWARTARDHERHVGARHPPLLTRTIRSRSGSFVHVFVDAATRRPTTVPAAIRSAIEAHLLG